MKIHNCQNYMDKIISIAQITNANIGTKEIFSTPPFGFGTVSMESKILTVFKSYTYVLSCKTTISLHINKTQCQYNE